MRKHSKIYTIKLADWIFVDPNLAQKYTSYIPISLRLLDSKYFEKLSKGGKLLTISLIQEAHKLGRSELEVSEKLVRSQGEVSEKVLGDLEQNQILTVSKLNSNSNSNLDVDNNYINFVIESEEDFVKKFQKFVIEEMGSTDLGFVKNYYKKVLDAFLSFDGFREFVDQVYDAKGFRTIEQRRSQVSYFKKALNSELDRRGLK